MALSNTRADKFMLIIKKCKDKMPTAITPLHQTMLFDTDEINAPRYKKMVFRLTYIGNNKQPFGDPVAKQSFKHFVQRTKDGDVFVYTNKTTGKKDVILKGYTDTFVTTNADWLVRQLREQILVNYPGHKPFFGDVHILRCEFIFTPPKSLTKKEEQIITDGYGILFKSTKPDEDNLKKLLWDAFQQAGVFTNDSQIASSNGFFKRYGNNPGVIVEIEGRI